MFDFWSRCTKQPGHDDLHGRSVSIEEEGKTRSRTRRRFVSASIDSIIVEVLSQLATLAFQDIRFISSSKNHRSGSSLSQRGTLDLPPRCTFLTRTFRLFLSFFLEGYRLLRSSCFSLSFFSWTKNFHFYR